VNGVVTDTSLPFNIYYNFGYYIDPRNVTTANGGILKIDTENFKFDETLGLWLELDSPTKFYSGHKDSDDFVSYYGRDLIRWGN
jgi:hypothetical protein